MFIVTDLTNKFPYRSHTNDIDTAADIVRGFTENERDYKIVTKVAADMRFGDVFAFRHDGACYSIECTRDLTEAKR